jgi:hypothetical protein
MKNILVISHERSGTHFAINSIAQNFENIDYKYKNVYSKDNGGENYKQDVERGFKEELEISSNDIKIFKSHHQFEFFEDYFDLLLERFHVFYVIRECADVMTSCYHYFNLHKSNPAFPYCTDIEKFLFQIKPYDYPYDGAYSLIKSENLVERWAQHIKGWKKVKKNICTIYYEQLKYDFQSVIEKMSVHLGEPKSHLTIPGLNFNTISPRKGIVGDWINLISQNQYDKINKITHNIIKG